MTKNERLQTELTQLLNLAAPPYRLAWIAYVKRKAEILRDWDSAYGDLPVLLDKALQTNLSASTQVPQSTGENEDARP